MWQRPHGLWRTSRTLRGSTHSDVLCLHVAVRRCCRPGVQASSGDLDNSPIIVEILTLRKEKAKLLGFETFADLSMASKVRGALIRRPVLSSPPWPPWGPSHACNRR